MYNTICKQVRAVSCNNEDDGEQKVENEKVREL